MCTLSVSQTVRFEPVCSMAACFLSYLDALVSFVNLVLRFFWKIAVEHFTAIFVFFEEIGTLVGEAQAVPHLVYLHLEVWTFLSAHVSISLGINVL